VGGGPSAETTLSGYKYQYWPWPAAAHQLIVDVKGDRDANIMFTPCDGCDGYRVLIGGWANQQSFIRDEANDKEGNDQTLVQTPGILSTTEFRRFYITLRNNSGEFSIQVRKDSESENFLEKSWNTDSLPWQPVKFVAFSGYTANPMHFRFKTATGHKCSPGWSVFGGKCYKYYSRNKTWKDARDYCLRMKADLASIHTLEENIFIGNLAVTTPIWIGGLRVGSNWVWSDGSLFDYTNWILGEPNNVNQAEKYIQIKDNWSPYGWNDSKGSHRFVCKQ